MKYLLTAFLLLAVAGLSFAAPLQSRERYQLIITTAPFGDIASQESLSAAPEQDPARVEEESNKIQLCAMTETPDGRTAVGLIDNGSNPPGYLTLFDGESSNGLTLVLSDLDREIATFRRDGIVFTLGLGLGLVETITPEMLAEQQAEEERLAEAERRRPNSLAEQLIAMQMSLPPDVEAPPLPIPLGDSEMFTKKFDPDKEETEAQSDTEAVIKAGVAQLEESVAMGETPQEYLQRLVEHRSAEVERQKAAKQAASEALEAELATGNYSESEAEQLRRQTNIELMKQGVVPLSPVNDLSASEQAEINAALNALQ